MNAFKKTYVTPEVEVQQITTGELMIEIGSGNTSPEESDSNNSFFDDEEDMGGFHAKNLCDD